MKILEFVFKMLAVTTEEERENIAYIRAIIGDSFEHATYLKPIKYKKR